MKKLILLAASVVLVVGNASACSCFGPQTFCETLNPQPPQFPDPQWWIPSDIILAVKLGDYQYAADVKVVQVFSGNLQQDDVVRVWGDCGLLCRHYVNGSIGDTVLWAIQHCDLMGNGLCGTDFEEAGDYHLSICGVYWPSYENGIVSGPLTVEGANESITLEAFAELVEGCLSTTVGEQKPMDPLIVHASGGTPWLSCALDRSLDLQVFDASGRMSLRRAWNGSPMPMNGLRPGVYLVQVTSEERRWMKRFMVGSNER